MRYWEDFEAGQTFDLGTHEMTRDEIVAFARQWDPQPYHLEEDGGPGAPFGGLIASGWHTACLVMRHYVEAVLSDAAAMGSPGLSELRWHAPVRPGDRLSMQLEVLDTAPSSVRADRGTVFLSASVTNQSGEVALSMRFRGMFGRRTG